jgi:flavin reductase (DIM6/NTAB) family NADH-FMN oxidoreductase RutF
MATPIKMSRPWNRGDLPVYSISSQTLHNQNMHIITYATAISMQPKMYVCGIYHGTQTLQNVKATGEFVLQLLADDQYRLIDLLGKKSGKQINKIERLQKRDEITTWHNYPILKNCLAVMHMQVMDTLPGGDHEIFVCKVTQWKNIKAGNALQLSLLRQKKLIRI